MNRAVKDVVIVGGGTAGWLTAGIIAAEHNTCLSDGLRVTLIESPDVKTIGVGEDTWPTMRASLEKIGIDEHELMRCCDASFKQGSCFVGWVNGQADERYYHPFTAPDAIGKCDFIAYWQQDKQQVPFANAFNYQSHLCEQGKAPKQMQTPPYAGVANYAYHLDAGKFAELLQKHCTEKLGVRHISDHVVKINSTTDEYIKSVTTKNNLEVKAGLFIDCSGFAAILLGRHYQVSYVERKHKYIAGLPTNRELISHIINSPNYRQSKSTRPRNPPRWA